MQITLNLTPNGHPPKINLKQYDQNGKTLTAYLIEDGAEYSIPSGSTVTWQGTKPDGYGFSYICTYSGNLVTIPITAQSTAVYGLVKCELMIESGSDNSIRTATVDMIVAKAALQNDTIISGDDFVSLQSYVTAAAASATAAAASASSAASSATTALSYKDDAELSATAAEDAKDDAEALLASFNSIVAGNEAYTKQQSDNRHASAIWLKQQSSNEMVQGIYPADGSQLDMTIYGKSTQDGTPSPSDPQEITSVGDSGELSVWAGGKNLAQLDGTTSALFNPTTWLSLEDRMATLVANPDSTTTASTYYKYGSETLYKDSTEYTIVFNVVDNSLDGVCNLVSSSSATRFSTISGLSGIAAGATGIFKGKQIISSGRSKANVFYTSILAATVTGSITYSFIILEGDYTNADITTDNWDEWAKYSEQANENLTLAEPLRGLPVTSGGNYTDAEGNQYICDTYNTLTGVRTNYIKEVVFDGEEYWRKSTTTTVDRYTTAVRDGESATTTGCICNYFATGTNADAGYMFISSYTVFAFSFASYGTTDISLWRAYLAELYANGTPLKVVYQLATPTTEQLDPVPLVMTQSDKYNPELVNVITSEGEFDCGFNQDGTYSYKQLLNAVLDAEGSTT